MWVAICVPSGGFVRNALCTSLLRMYEYYHRVPVLGREDEDRRLSYHTIESSTIGAARDWFVDDVLAIKDTAGGQPTHLLFIDDDMGFRPDTLHILLSRQMPFVACNYRIKIPPCDFTAVALDGSRVQTDNAADSLTEVDFTGLGFALIERQVLEAVAKPRFLNTYNEELGGYTTEDRPFCQAARAAGFPVMVDHRASKRVFHMGNYNYCWDDDFSQKERLPLSERIR